MAQNPGPDGGFLPTTGAQSMLIAVAAAGSEGVAIQPVGTLRNAWNGDAAGSKPSMPALNPSVKSPEPNLTRLSPDVLAIPSRTEFDETLKRLVDRITRILQSERCVFLLHDTVSGTLYPTHPAFGFDAAELDAVGRGIAEDGVAYQVFRSNTPHVIRDAANDPGAVADGLAGAGVRNGITVPLTVERREDDTHPLERTVVGVLHVFNKKSNGEFDGEDVRLLQRMAMMAAVVFASAALYREAVQESQDLIYTIDSLMAGLLMVGTNGRVLQINPSARAILKIKSTVPVIGVPYHRAIPNERVRELLARVLTENASEVAGEISVTLRSKNGRSGNAADTSPGERTYQVQCAPVRDAAGAASGVVAVFSDITQIRGIERMKDDFLSTVSHELRTPLTSIKGFISTLLGDDDGYFTAGQRHEFYGIMDAECDRLTRLIDDLLNISRIEQGRAMQLNWDVVDIPSIVGGLVAVRRASAMDHQIELDFPNDFPRIAGDTDKIGQVFRNLVDNAIKYSPNGGLVEVIGRCGPDSRCVTVNVVDHGIGIAPEHQQHVFDRFYRIDNRDNRDIGGTGIGLALVKALVKAHGGAVSVESSPGLGSSFSVILPITRSEGTGETADARASTA
ncbi:MAG: ATP-binding protein [Capsulimonadaceae bacterium]